MTLVTAAATPPATPAVTALEQPSPAVLATFDTPGPRYTSYPTADRFNDAFDAAAYMQALAQRAQAPAPPPLSLYVHLPFCDTICYYCACNKVVTRNHGRVNEYLAAVAREAELVVATLAPSALLPLEQLHLGGGTPTFLSNDELSDLMRTLNRHFTFGDRAEVSVEVDPRSTPPGKVGLLAQLGFNRMSVGVQDFDANVQRAVNRNQTLMQALSTIEAARACGFRSINLDLIYGLPMQTRSSFHATLDRVLEVAPDRVALYHYAHLPARFKPQRRIDTALLPPPAEKAAIMADAIERLTGAGYVYIGMDHFARADDELARAQAAGHLHRNFQGYSTRAECDLIGLGVSAIGKVGPAYAQNTRSLDEYYDALARGRLPTVRGLRLDRDDSLRRDVIMSLMCSFTVNKRAVAEQHEIDFDTCFRAERMALTRFIDAGLVEETAAAIHVTPRGRLLVRAVAMVFDRYVQADRERPAGPLPYSKVV